MVNGRRSDILSPSSRSDNGKAPCKRSMPFIIPVLAFLTVTNVVWRSTRVMPANLLDDELRFLQQTPLSALNALLLSPGDNHEVEIRIQPLQLQYKIEDNSVRRIDLQMLPEILEDPHKKRNDVVDFQSAPDYKSNNNKSNNNDDDNSDEDGDDDDGYDDDCHVVNRQHKRVFPTCTRVHEIDETNLSFINCGGSRCAFYFNDDYDFGSADDGSSQHHDRRRVVLKLQK